MRRIAEEHPSRAGHVLLILALIGIVPVVAALRAPTSATTGDHEITLVADADASVHASQPRHHFGSRKQLAVHQEPRLRSYVRFRLPELTDEVDRASLALHLEKAVSGRVRVRLASSRWSERAVTFRSAPKPHRTIAAIRAGTTAGWIHIDVTAAVAARVGGSVTFVFGSQNRQTTFSSRETIALGPKLHITHGRGPKDSPSPTPGTTSTPPPTSSGPGDVQPTFPIRAAFYYPWFPETWGNLSSPFTQYNPSLGWYDSTDPALVQAHIGAMEYAGIDAGISSWWGQGSKTDQRMPALLRGADGTPFRWTIYYEPEGQGDPSVSQISIDLSYLVDHYGSDPSYLRINGRPVVFAYSDGSDGCSMVDRWQQANTVHAYVVLKVFPGYKTCASQPDGWHQYGPSTHASDMSPYSYSVSPGFWKKGESSPRLDRDPSRFAQDVQNMVASHADFQLVTTFNEWGEGTAVESATEWATSSGFGRYLDILHANGDTGGSSSSSSPPPTSSSSTPPTSTSSSPPSSGDPVIAAAGDIACSPTDGSFNGGSGSSTNCHEEATSDLLLRNPVDAVLTLGDNQYEEGTLSAFQASYDPTWGRVFAMTHPAIGNHEYLTSGASGYFSYFGSAAGQSDKGYYSYNIGSWHLIALNSNCSMIGGCGSGSPQLTWLQQDLSSHSATCTLAYWHHPRWSSGEHGSQTGVAPLWNALVSAGADVVLNGHDHDYERFAPQDANGNRDDAHGIREFVVGTGGKNHYGMNSPIANSQVHNTDTYGVLMLTLHPTGYDWQFVPEAGKTFTDSGSDTCH